MRRGMSEYALARQAGMSPRYLQHVLQAGPDFDREGFERIAGALGMSLDDLVAGRRDAPAGQHGPAEHPVLVKLTPTQCWDRLGARGVGRIALPSEPGPAVFPVNYAVIARTIVYRTGLTTAGALATGDAVSFQADHVDEAVREGWSVLVTGTAERIEDQKAVQRLAEMNIVEPWAGGDRPLWIRIRPQNVSGRRIATL